MNTTFEIVFPEVSECASTAQHLCLDNILDLSLFESELFGHKIRFFSLESDVAQGDRHMVLAYQLSGLVLVELHATHWQRSVVNQCAIQ